MAAKMFGMKYQYLFDFDASITDIGNWMGSLIIHQQLGVLSLLTLLCETWPRCLPLSELLSSKFVRFKISIFVQHATISISVKSKNSLLHFTFKSQH